MSESAGSGGGERTEAATPRRIEKAREQGQVALSREVAPTLILAVTALLLGPGLPMLADLVTGRLTLLLAGIDHLDPLVASAAALRCVEFAVLPLAGLAALATALAVLGQTGLLIRPEALLSGLGRVNPIQGARRLFSGAMLAEAGRAVVKFLMVAAASWFVLRDAGGLVAAWLAPAPASMLPPVRALALHLVLVVLAGQAVLAAADVLRARMSLASTLRMTRQEVRDEQRESDGDPQIKARIRRLRQQRAKRRMMAAVPTATVVVTNPTHYAVALAYERGSTGAPRVVAKGIDAMAARIREVAEKARVPLIANPPLARALWRIELEAEVPAELFQAVAEVIAMVWRLRLPRGRL